MAGYHDRQAATSRSAAKSRIKAVYDNWGLPLPPNVERQIDRVISSGGDYLDMIRIHAKNDPNASQFHAGDPFHPDNRNPVDKNPPGGQVGPGPGLSPPPGADQIAEPPAFDFLREARVAVPWLPEPLIQLYAKEWATTGSPDLAMAHVRQSPTYKTYFPGNERDDGTFRWSEQGYMANMEGFRTAVRGYDINPDVFEDKFVQLMEAEVDAAELEGMLRDRYQQVASMGDGVRSAYSQYFADGQYLSDSALMVGLLEPGIDPAVYQEQYETAQIGGSAIDAGFELALRDAERLQNFGFSREAANRTFSQARNIVPTLRQLVERHNDDDSDFDLNEYLDAVVFSDPDQQKRINRLFAQEESAFSRERSIAGDREGRLTGLSAR